MTAIFALASGHGRCGVSVVRVSGPQALDAVRYLCPKLSENVVPRQAYFTKLVDMKGAELDQILLLYFQAPHSFTGEDVVEFHCHGSAYVIETLLSILAEQPGLKMAEPGEFTRRAFENGKLDLTQAEGLYDLIHSQTEAQHHLALGQLNGALSEKYQSWHERLKQVLSYAEAAIDFADEELPAGFQKQIDEKISQLELQISQHMQGSKGEQIREGFSVVILGAPNVGKSSMINTLANKELAIVSDMAGTTRDMIEASVQLNGQLVVFVDTAGLNKTPRDAVEAEGIRRARERAEKADLKLVMLAADQLEWPEGVPQDDRTLVVINKADKEKPSLPSDIEKTSPFFVSVKQGDGLDALLSHVGNFLAGLNKEAVPLTRVRHRLALEQVLEWLRTARTAPEVGLLAEGLRCAMRELGGITGQVDIEDLLDVIFADFCIGK